MAQLTKSASWMLRLEIAFRTAQPRKLCVKRGSVRGPLGPDALAESSVYPIRLSPLPIPVIARSRYESSSFSHAPNRFCLLKERHGVMNVIVAERTAQRGLHENEVLHD